MARERGPDGRWVPSGGPVPTDGSGPPTAVVILPAATDPGATEWGCRQVTAGMAVDFHAAHLVDGMTRAALVHMRTAILTGQRPDGGGEQKELGKQASSNPDRQSPHRGYRTGELADGLRRTAIRTDGQTASSTILPPTTRTVYVATEASRGVNLITGAGAAGEAAAGAAREVAAMMSAGQLLGGTRDEVVAVDAEP